MIACPYCGDVAWAERPHPRRFPYCHLCAEWMRMLPFTMQLEPEYDEADYYLLIQRAVAVGRTFSRHPRRDPPTILS